ncbi:MAG: DUF1295 domain-containing protein [Bacilli bacterium]|nr:DUF1295 domain-containing protein [Bacilli bacterium]
MRKLTGVCTIIGVYMMIFGAVSLPGSLFHTKLGWPLLPNLLLLDVIATVLVFIVGYFVKSPSFYDPYWSVQTWIFYLFVLIEYGNWNVGSVLVFAVLTFYSVRLTVHFFIGFDDLQYVDWRYRMLRQKAGKNFQLVSFFGIHMMPTLLVYLASVPFFLYAENWAFHPLDIIGLSVMVAAVTVEMVADLQMKKWRATRSSREEVGEVGLWKYSRHPNYLGEISFWFGGALLLLAHLDHWYWMAGAIAILVLFLVVSIPMIEKNFLTYKPDYPEYQRRTHMLLILPLKGGKKNP